MKVEENFIHNLIKVQVLGLCECFKTGFYTFILYTLGESCKI